jgi:molybdenum cofactor synthesis domain-containing protein
MMSNSSTVLSVNVSDKKGTVKKPVSRIVVDDNGMLGDGHAGPWHRQISMLSQEAIDRFSKEANKEFAPGQFAENITTSGIDLDQVAVLDRFCIGPVELEVTQLGKKCHGDTCAIFKETGKCVMPQKGIFCRVIHGGTIKPGDSIKYVPKLLKVLIVTLSDRAFSGQYEDRSGPRMKQILLEHFKSSRWHHQVENVILADDAENLRKTLTGAISEKIDVIFTCGGTGVGPRDITPETVESVCDKIIPGIMENIRVKYGSQKPSALLSRSIAAIAGTTQVYALPGSVRAVEEYLIEILKTLEHVIFMIHRLDIH